MNTFASINTISLRKQHHIDACRSGGEEKIEGGTSGFAEVKFLHTALPELSWDEIDTSVDFLGKKIALPLFISCMTGGSEEGKEANLALAKAAQKCGIPIGLGSMRVLLEDPSRLSDFCVRSAAPDVPVMANLGAVQLQGSNPNEIESLMQKVEADALVIHLNCGQELFQTGGDRDFRGLLSAIEQAAAHFSFPIIVKETGFGIRPALVQKLLQSGVAYVDLAGSGGTNWALVEKECGGDALAAEFADWGISTALLLESLQSERVLASGGLRSGMDLAKAIALGAHAAGMALPLFQAALEGGEPAVTKKIHEIAYVLKSVMLLTGCREVADLRKAPLLKSGELQQQAKTLREIDGLA